MDQLKKEHENMGRIRLTASLTDLKKDMSIPENVTLAKKYESKILKHIKEHPGCSMSDLYTELKLDDIPMYIALHNLVKAGKIEGVSPYETDLGNHSKYHYTAKAAAFITAQLDDLADEIQKHDPRIALAIDRVSDMLEKRV